jgi:hypothetical protein
MEIYIDTDKLDLSEKQVIAMTFQANDLGEFASRQSSYSNGFKAVRSDRNDEILGNASSLTSLSAIPYRVQNCRVYSRGALIDGDALLNVIEAGNEYGLNVYSGFVNFADAIQDKSLQDLDTTDIDLVKSNGGKHWDIGGMSTIYGSAISPTFVAVQDGNLPINSRDVDVRKQYPSVYIWELIKRITEGAGWTLESDLIFTDDFKKKILPFTNDYPKQAKLEIDNAYVKLNKLVDVIVPFATPSVNTVPIWNELSDVGNKYDPTIAQYIIDYAGKYIIDIYQPIRCHFKTATASVGYSATPYVYYGLYKNGTLVSNKLVHQTFNSLTPLSFVKEFDISGQWAVDCLDGDVLTIKVITVCGGFSPSPSHLTGSDYYVEYLYRNDSTNVPAKLTFTLDDHLPYHGHWRVATNLPDISQSDFIKSMLLMYNLVPFVDARNKVLTLLKFSTIADRSRAVDWSGYEADIQPQIKLHATSYAQTNEINYKTDANVQGDYNGSFSINDTTLALKKTLVELPYSGADLGECLNGLLVAECLRVLSDASEVTPTPKILTIAEDSQGCALVDGSFTVNESTTFYATFTDDIQTLIDTHYIEFVELLQRYKECLFEMILPESMVQELDLSRCVYIARFGAYFYVNKIDAWKDGLTRCKVTLIKL